MSAVTTLHSVSTASSGRPPPRTSGGRGVTFSFNCTPSTFLQTYATIFLCVTPGFPCCLPFSQHDEKSRPTHLCIFPRAMVLHDLPSKNYTGLTLPKIGTFPSPRLRNLSRDACTRDAHVVHTWCTRWCLASAPRCPTARPRQTAVSRARSSV